MRDLIIAAIVNQSHAPTEDEFRIIQNKGYRYKIMNTVERLEWFLKQFDNAARVAAAKPARLSGVKEQISRENTPKGRARAEKRLMDDDY